MNLLSAVVRALVGRLERPPGDRAPEEAAYAEIRSSGVKCPERFVSMLAPGFAGAA